LVGSRTDFPATHQVNITFRHKIIALKPPFKCCSITIIITGKRPVNQILRESGCLSGFFHQLHIHLTAEGIEEGAV
jgi:hypothetical protein